MENAKKFQVHCASLMITMAASPFLMHEIHTQHLFPKFHGIFSQLWLKVTHNLSLPCLLWPEIHPSPSPAPSKKKLVTSTFIQHQCFANNTFPFNYLSHIHVIYINSTGAIPSYCSFRIGGLKIEKQLFLY